MLSPKNLLILAALPLLIAPAFAADEGGSESGGGENSVVCFNNPAIPAAIRDKTSSRYGLILDSELGAITDVEAYDLYEARMPRGLNREVPQIVGIGGNETARDYIEKIAKRFEPYVPYVALLVRHGASVFTDKRIIVRPAGLKRVHDENDVGYIDAGHCVVATMAAQYFTGSEPQLQLDDRLFGNAHNSRLSQGVLFLHESIYYTARNTFKHTDSRATRTLVGALINAAPTSSAAVIDLLKSLNLTADSSASNAYAQNYLAAMLETFFSDSAPTLDKILKAKHAKDNTRFAQLYNRWVDTYFTSQPNGGRNYFGDAPEKLTRRKDGTYASVDEDFLKYKNDTCMNPVAERCEAYRKALLKEVKGEKESMRRKAVEVIAGLANEKLFPDLAKLTQVDAPTKAKAQELMIQAIQKGTTYIEEVWREDERYHDEYRFKGEAGSLEAIRQLNLTIP